MYAGLKRILKIRNKFAHVHKPLSFQDESVSGECEQLNLIDLSSLYSNFNPRDHFLIQSMVLVEQLLVGGHSLKHLDVGKDFTLSKIVRG